MRTIIINGTVFTPRRKIEKGWVEIENGKITRLGEQSTLNLKNAEVVYNAENLAVCPGLIDVHTHGLLGYDAMGADLGMVIQKYPQFGVTSFMATTLTYPRQEVINALTEMGRQLTEPPRGAHCLGIHLEGPHLSPAKPGMATAEWVYPLNQQDVVDFQAASRGHLRMITFAPEAPGALEVIPYLIQNNIIPVIGHSEADYETVKKAASLGLNHATHTYNAMRPLNHREPGVVGAVMTIDEIYAELIGDGVHVHPVAMEILFRAKGMDKVVLISDSAPFANMPEGQYEWEHKPLIVKNGKCTLEDGTLAGAYHCLDAGVRNLVNLLGYPLEKALLPATTNPARSVGIFDRGALEPGYWADISLFNSDLQPAATFCAGDLVWEKEKG
ncbi:MAG TPA: N-acetylglucosamine-6-phosphate deacetylase [Anaerolineales bacterium]|nr:N-acetylglucosamine-6-phosphate deacetylase [Anaerolineales bacterium]